MGSRRTRRLQGVALAAAACLALAACGGASGGAAQGPTGEPQPGGTIRMLMNYDGPDLDPIHTTVAATAFGNQLLPIFDTLIRVDAQGTITPRIATAVTTTDGGTTWTVKLRDGVRFSDGTPFDAAALKFNWERDAEPESGQTSDARQITAMTVVDPTTLQATLASPNTSFPYLLQGPIGMIGSPTAIQTKGDQYSVAPVGAGPFVLDKRVPGSSYSYKKNPGYWDAPRPYADALEIRLIPETAQMASSFQAGEADLMSGPTGAAVWRQTEEQGTRVLKPVTFGGNAVWFNTTRAPVDDVRVRRALVMAMDPQDANDKADEGAATVSDNIFPEDSPYFDPAARIPYNGDLAQAQALIDSYVAEKGGPVTLTWLTTEGNNRRWVEAYAQQVNQKLENVDFKVEVVTTALALQSFYDDSFQVLGSSFIGVDPVLQMNQRLACGSGRNNANYCNQEVDAAFKQALRSPDQATRVDAVKKAQEALWKDVPFFLQSRAINYTATSENLGGVDSFAEGLLTLDSAWLATP